MERIDFDAPVRRTVLRLSWPPFLDYLLNTLYTLVDLYFVGKLSSAAVGALGVAWPVNFTAQAFFMALGVGAAAAVSRHVGAGRFRRAAQAAASSSLVQALAGLGMGLLAAALARPIFGLFGVSEEVAREGVAYLVPAALAWWARGLYINATYVLRASGEVKLPLFISAASLLLGFGLDALLIPKLGIRGAGYAWFSVTLLQALLGLVFLAKALRVKPKDAFGGFGELPWMARVAAPSFAENVTQRLGFLGFVRIVTGLGTQALAAHIVAVRIESLSFMPGIGLGNAAGALAGQGVGAKLPRKAQGHVNSLVKLALLLMLGMSGFMVLASVGGLPKLFAPEPEVASLASAVLLVAALEQPAFGMMAPYQWALRVSGWTEAAWAITAAGLFLIRLPLGFALAYWAGWGLVGAWVAGVADWYARGLAAMALFNSKAWVRRVMARTLP